MLYKKAIAVQSIGSQLSNVIPAIYQGMLDSSDS
ncbi:hypothetical protein VMF7928_00422 [Vibrio marisflavi CECT 7928]|uniref:Uncharacterized protein n=1 Tax=Vibrio marisflavi CECT 7928 TaxID=634439 RepID=A0ABN8E283_9VIBR|nr:hypothetical protein VMF7928_00422 [Vibrio marisflavi CECT 7928]